MSADARPSDNEPAYPPLHPERLTWAALLGRWVDFAQASLALPTTGDAGRLRRSVSDIITLQAVWMALQDLEDLDPDQRRLGLDRAGLLIRTHTDKLQRRYEPEPLPEAVTELIDDATKAHAEARQAFT